MREPHLITEALRYGTRCQGITQIYLPPKRLSTNGMNHAFALLGEGDKPTPEGSKAELTYSSQRRVQTWPGPLRGEYRRHCCQWGSFWVKTGAVTNFYGTVR